MTTIAHTQPARLTVGSTPTKRCTWPAPRTSWAAGWRPPWGDHHRRLRRAAGWADALGQVEAFGIEGTGCSGAELARFLRGHGQRVLESTGQTGPPAAAMASPTRPPPAPCRPARRPACQGWRWRGGDGAGAPGRPPDGHAGPHPDHQRAQGLGGHRPDSLRQQLRDLPTRQLVATAAAFQPDTPAPRPWPRWWRLAPSPAATRSWTARSRCAASSCTGWFAWRRQRCWRCSVSVPDRSGAAGGRRGQPAAAALRRRPRGLVWRLTDRGVLGQDGAARLNRGGDRQANNALWRIVVVRRRAGHPATVAYLQRRTAQGKSKRAAIRCLKRHVAREIFAVLTTMADQALTTAA